MDIFVVGMRCGAVQLADPCWMFKRPDAVGPRMGVGRSDNDGVLLGASVGRVGCSMLIEAPLFRWVGRRWYTGVEYGAGMPSGVPKRVGMLRDLSQPRE